MWVFSHCTARKWPAPPNTQGGSDIILSKEVEAHARIHKSELPPLEGLDHILHQPPGFGFRLNPINISLSVRNGTYNVPRDPQILLPLRHTPSPISTLCPRRARQALQL